MPLEADLVAALDDEALALVALGAAAGAGAAASVDIVGNDKGGEVGGES